jgi:hydroxymethylpyrimidine pyrophosphatase-like HAD family hydrolase
MLKLAVFDLDNTLAKLGKGILPEDVELLRRLEGRGVHIAVCSGKPTYYLCGFLRQVELEAPILIGENGAVIQFGVDLPPKTYEILPHSDAAKETIRFLRGRFDALLPHLWYQPNRVGLTPFPASEEEFDLLARCMEENRDHIRDVTVYRHVDTYDITPNGITKFEGLKRLGELLDIPPSDTAAVGDGVNDYPMFDYAGVRLGVNVAQPERVDKNFSCVKDALNYLMTLT